MGADFFLNIVNLLKNSYGKGKWNKAIWDIIRGLLKKKYMIKKS